MMELGLELLLKEPVITKVLFSIFIFKPAFRLTQLFSVKQKNAGGRRPRSG